MNALETAARNFVVSPKAGRHLERHRSTVLTLRAKDATFPQVQDLLAEHGVIVSESSITRFAESIAPRFNGCDCSLNRISMCHRHPLPSQRRQRSR